MPQNQHHKHLQLYHGFCCSISFARSKISKGLVDCYFHFESHLIHQTNIMNPFNYTMSFVEYFISFAGSRISKEKAFIILVFKLAQSSAFSENI
jgi:hypothetical protein